MHSENFRKMPKKSKSSILDCKFLALPTWILPFPEFPALNGLYLTIFVVSPMASGFRNSWDTLARDLCAAWGTQRLPGFPHGISHAEHQAMPNPGPNASCPGRSDNARRAGSGSLERAAGPLHRCSTADSGAGNPRCLRGSCCPAFLAATKGPKISGVSVSHG